MKRKITTFEFLIALFVMTVFVYTLIKRGNVEVVEKMTNMDSTMKLTNKNLKEINDSFHTFSPLMFKVDGALTDLYFRQTDVLDMTLNNSKSINKTNELISKNLNYLIIINMQQKILMDSLKKFKKTDTIYIKSLEDSK